MVLFDDALFIVAPFNVSLSDLRMFNVASFTAVLFQVASF